MIPHRIGIIGLGVMGRALASALVDVVTPGDLWAAVRTEAALRSVGPLPEIEVVSDFREMLAGTQLVLLCVKPRDIGPVCRTIRSAGTLPPRTAVVSIAAGVGLAEIEASLPQGQPALRAMPNMPVRVRHGMTILCRGRHAEDAHMADAGRIFDAVGDSIVLPEAMMDAATAVSASGPAFFYLIAEALVDAAVGQGLPREVASRLTTQCLLGSGETMRITRSHPALLRDEVTTPGGCTIAGVLTLENGGLRSTLTRAIEKTSQIASELSTRGMPLDGRPIPSGR